MLKVDSGLVTGNVDLNNLEFNKDDEIINIVDFLTQDMLQISFDGGNLIVDVGWYPCMDISGRFRIVIIKDYDWDNPLELKNASTLAELEEKITSAISKVENMLMCD